MTDGVLAGLRVLDLADGLAGQVAALLLAEAGAEVVKLEPPDGPPLRGTPPFAVWNRSKQSLALDPFGDGRAAFIALLKGADVLIHDRPWRQAKDLGLDPDTLSQHAPALIACAVTAFPRGHADDDTATDDVLMTAAGGLMDEQKAVRRDGPCYLRYPFGSYAAAWLAASGVVARLLWMRRGGRPGPVETSLFQGALVPTLMLWNRAETPTPVMAAGMPKNVASPLLECADGVWVHFMGASPEKTPSMQAALAAMSPEAIAEANAEYQGHAGSSANWGAIRRALKTRSSADWLADFWASDVAVQPAVSMGKVYFDEQARLNDYVIEVSDPQLGRTLQPGTAYFMTPPGAFKGPAMAPSRDVGAVLARWTERAAPVGGKTNGKPLEGLKVIDMGNFVAGPIAPMLMADLGAEVIKIEAVTGDQMRGTEWAFCGAQRGKRSLALDMKKPGAQAVLERFVREADVMHHNLRLPAAERIGLGPDRLRAVNPALVYCHLSSYGPTGPRKDWPGFDQLFQAASGWEYEGAGEGNPPIWHRFGMMDHMGGLSTLFATLLGLYQRAATGEGQFLGSSLLGASLLTVSETLVLPDGTLAPYDRLDAEQTGVAPWKRIYRCADREWIAVSSSKAAFERALASMGAADAEAAFAARSAVQALAALKDAGVLCAPVRLDQGTAAFFDDPNNRRIRLAVGYRHPVYGHFEQPGAVWAFGDLDLVLDRAPPTIGQHTEELLKEYGYGSAEIDRLSADKIVRGVGEEPAVV